MNTSVETFHEMYKMAVANYAWYQPSKFSIFQGEKKQSLADYWARSARSYSDAIKKELSK